jgi:hypothetical protein
MRGHPLFAFKLEEEDNGCPCFRAGLRAAGQDHLSEARSRASTELPDAMDEPYLRCFSTSGPLLFLEQLAFNSRAFKYDNGWIISRFKVVRQAAVWSLGVPGHPVMAASNARDFFSFVFGGHRKIN